jgi:hypothetical protein
MPLAQSTQLSDVVVPEIFGPYVQQITAQKSRIIQSRAGTVDARLNLLLQGGGFTFNEPSFRDLSSLADERVSTDNPATDSTPDKVTAATEVQVRLSRNNSWSSMDLTADLAGADPMQSVATRVADYWVRRHQNAFVSTMSGVFASNAAGPTGSLGALGGTAGDMTFDISGGATGTFANGVTNFSAAAFIDAAGTMGDSMDDLTMVMMHSVVYARALKNNLIDFIPASINEQATRIPTFLGREVVVDDGVPHNGAVFDTWIFAAGSVRLGIGSPRVPSEVWRHPSLGNGGGAEVLHSRVEWAIHPVGWAVLPAATATPGNSPTNAILSAATSWSRVFNERKQIKVARLVSREY